MRFVDVNVLVYAHRRDVPRHDEYRSWLVDALNGPEPVGLTDEVLAGVLRIVTHPRIFGDPTDLRRALVYAEEVRSAPAAIRVQPGKSTWPILVDLLEQAEARGNLVPDALLAAQAIELGATMVTADRGFARFAGLRVQHPLD